MEQDLIRERYDLSMARIRDFLTEETVPEVYRDYFKKVTELIIQCGEVLKAKKDGSLDKMTLEEGRALNQKLYADVLPGAYETSYANPAYAVQTLGEEYGKLLSYLYAEIRAD
ncbi:MAG: leucyl aminopeptidase, partial [Clostridium sp.]|nr:leucyl aminopeptidase [Clostridium sp.]